MIPSISQSNNHVPLNNMVLHKDPIVISPVTFADFLGNEVKINDHRGNIIIINFWATWCLPCREEMPSLDNLTNNYNFKNLLVFAINVEKPNKEKTVKFFDDIGIKNLKIFFDPNLNFVKQMKLRGVPTTVFLNKRGQEFARIQGSANFENKKFIEWLYKQ